MAEDRVAGYAKAILEVARAEGELDRLESELFQVARSVESSTELAEALADRRIPMERRIAIIEDLLGSKASPLTVALVNFIVGAERARELPEIVDAFVSEAVAARDREVAEVRTAVPLDTETVRRLERALSQATSKQVEIKVVVDPGVLGGLVAQVGDTVIDGSIRSRLDSLRQALRPT